MKGSMRCLTIFAALCASLVSADVEEGLYCPPTNDGPDILYPKADNCSEFYQCSYGKLYTLHCQPGLYYCAEKNWCDYTYNCDYSNCKMSLVKLPPKEEDKNEQDNGEEQNKGGEQEENGDLYCPPTWEGEDVLYPKAENCGEFYKCHLGSLHTIPCPQGLYYCAAKQWCDYPDNCDYSNCKILPEEDNKNEQGKEDEQNKGEEQEENGDLYCPPTWDGEDVLYPKAENCGEFYKCNMGNLHTLQCPQGLYYCAAKQWCDYPDNCDYSNCKISPEEDNKNEQDKEDEQNKGEEQDEDGEDENGELYCPPTNDGPNILYPKAENCSEFYQCSYGKLFTHHCAPGLYYCAENKWCDYPDNCDYSNCKMSLVKLPPKEEEKNEQDNGEEQNKGEEQEENGDLYCPPTWDGEDVLYPKADNCAEFYKCNMGSLHTLQCPKGLYYCAAKQWCDYPDNCDYSTCKFSLVKLPPKEENNEEQDKDAKPDKGEEQNTSGEISCVGRSEGALFVNPENCNQFYQCSLGRAYIKTCPASLYFCESKNVCDYPDNCHYSCKKP